MITKDYLPPKLYIGLFEFAQKHHLAVKELQTIVFRKFLEEHTGFDCKHENIAFAKSNGLPYCKECWVRLEQVKAPVYIGRTMKKSGVFKPKPSILEEMETLK
jgi:hypothetical protein